MAKLIVNTVLIACFATPAGAADFVLVAEGMPPAPIIIFKDAPLRTRDAAVTLAKYIGEISVRKPEIIDGEPSPVPERAIWIVPLRNDLLVPRTDRSPRTPIQRLQAEAGFIEKDEGHPPSPGLF